MRNAKEPLLTLGIGDVISQGAIVYPIELFKRSPSTPFKITTFEVHPGCETPQDEHQVEEVWVVQAGTGKLTYEKTNLTIKTGQILYFAAFKKHQVTNTGKDVLKILSIYW